LERRREFLILGPLEVRADGSSVPIAGSKPRALLAALLLNANRVVPTDRLIDFLWGEEPPETARGVLQTYVSQLRQHLEGERPAGAPARMVVKQPSGYLLRLAPGELDLGRFQALVDEARKDLEEGSLGRAAGRLREALGLWRGPALAEFDSAAAERERARLEEMRLAALETRIDADLRLGRHLELVGELRELVSEHPLREGLWGRLMLALHRAGRSGEAAAAYQEARRVLSEELGMEPGPDLQRLLKDILNHDPRLDPRPEGASGPARPAEAAAAPPSRRPTVPLAALGARRWLALGLAGAIVGALGAMSWTLFHPRSGAGGPMAAVPSDPCAFEDPGQPIWAGAGGPSCGLQLGQPWIDLDCARASAIPGGFIEWSIDQRDPRIQRRSPQSIRESGGDCLFVATSSTSATLRTVDDVPTDAVVLVDFTPVAESSVQVSTRCHPVGYNCVGAAAGPGVAPYIVQFVPAPRDLGTSEHDLAPANRESRLVVSVRGPLVQVWLNGHFEVERETIVTAPGFAAITASEQGAAGQPTAVVRVHRFAVYYPASPAPAPTTTGR
jgi:DNA-binding SARP family transcriptional activator